MLRPIYGAETFAMPRNETAQLLETLSCQFDGELSWDLIGKTEVALGKLILEGPTGRTRTAVAAFSHRVKALERWLVRAADTLRDNETANGRRHPSHHRERSRNGSPPTQGPQTLGELVLERCGPESDEWRQFQRLNRLFGVSTPEDLDLAIKREQELLDRYAPKATQQAQSVSI